MRTQLRNSDLCQPDRTLDLCADGLTGVSGDRDPCGQVPAEGMMDRVGDTLSLSWRESLIGNIDHNPATFFILN